jgi:hypothetical protein
MAPHYLFMCHSESGQVIPNVALVVRCDPKWQSAGTDR